MLASITPLGERGRQAHWSLTVTAFLLGATATGALAGLVAASVGALLVPAGFGVHARLALLALVVLVAILLDLLPRRVPGPRRQVNERWLDEYRGWVYGLGFGAQLGLGVTTIVSSAATYAALIAALLSAGPARGALIVGCYGAVRGLTPLAAARVRTTPQLIALHARLDRWRALAARGAPLLMSGIAVLAVAGSVT